MKHLVTVAITLLFAYSISAQQWTDVESLPSSARKHHPVTFSLNGTGYSVTGSNAFDISTNTFHSYDPILDEWDELDDFPGAARSFSYGVTDDNFAYLGFGYNTEVGQFYNDLWKFDPADQSWEELASCPCEPRTHPALVHVDGKIYVGAGGSAFGNRTDWWEYDVATDVWTQKDNFPGANRHHPYYFDLGGYAYVGFGHGDGIYNDFYRYDPADESWEQMADFPGEARVAGTQFSHEGFGYILSGDGDDHDYMLAGEFWQYDPSSDSWAQLPSHPGLSRWAPGSFIIDGEAYLVQGQERYLDQFPGSAQSNDVKKFDIDLYNSPFSINENSKGNTLSVFPNPTNGIVNIKSSDSSLATTIQVIVTNLLGEEVLTEQASTTSSIDLTSLTPGAYSVQLITGNQVETIQVVKQ